MLTFTLTARKVALHFSLAFVCLISAIDTISFIKRRKKEAL